MLNRVKAAIADPRFKDVFKFALPVLADQFFLTVLLSVNLMFCSRAGVYVTSAVGNVDSIHTTANQIFLALATGGTVVVARDIGAREPQNAAKAGWQAMLSGTLIVTLLSFIVWFFREPIILALYGKAEAEITRLSLEYMSISVFSYPLLYYSIQGFGVLRGFGDSRTPMNINAVTTAVNILIGFVLIYGLDIGGTTIGGFGTHGVAWTLIMVRAVSCVLVTYTLFDKNRTGNLCGCVTLRLNAATLREIYGIGVPTSTESMIFMCGRLVTQSFISGMGTVAIAANNIGNSIMNYLALTSNAFIVVNTTMVGRAVGTGLRSECRKAMNYTLMITQAMIVTINLAIGLLSPIIVKLYIDDPVIEALTVSLVWSYVISSFVLQNLSFVLPSGFRGAGDVNFTLVVAVASMWLCRVLMGYYLGVTLGLGVYGVWAAMYIDWIARIAFFLWRYLTGGWLKHANLEDNACQE